MKLDERVARLERALVKATERILGEYPMRGRSDDPGIVAFREIRDEIEALDRMAAVAARRDALRDELAAYEEVGF